MTLPRRVRAVARLVSELLVARVGDTVLAGSCAASTYALTRVLNDGGFGRAREEGASKIGCHYWTVLDVEGVEWVVDLTFRQFRVSASRVYSFVKTPGRLARYLRFMGFTENDLVGRRHLLKVGPHLNIPVLAYADVPRMLRGLWT